MRKPKRRFVWCVPEAACRRQMTRFQQMITGARCFIQIKLIPGLQEEMEVRHAPAGGPIKNSRRVMEQAMLERLPEKIFCFLDCTHFQQALGDARHSHIETWRVGLRCNPMAENPV